MNKREQHKFNSVLADSSRDADIDSSAQTANNTNIHFQTHNSKIARSFVGMYFKYICSIINLKLKKFFFQSLDWLNNFDGSPLVSIYYSYF